MTVISNAVSYDIYKNDSKSQIDPESHCILRYSIYPSMCRRLNLIFSQLIEWKDILFYLKDPPPLRPETVTSLDIISFWFYNGSRYVVVNYS